VTAEHERRGALEAVDRILNRGGDADDVLRAVLVVLFQLYAYVGIRFAEEGRFVPGPSLGERDEQAEQFPVVFEGIEVARLEAASPGSEDRPFLERVALLISPYCLVGWDTGGEPWAP
jgi:hypothetical protein